MATIAYWPDFLEVVALLSPSSVFWSTSKADLCFSFDHLAILPVFRWIFNLQQLLVCAKAVINYSSVMLTNFRLTNFRLIYVDKSPSSNIYSEIAHNYVHAWKYLALVWHNGVVWVAWCTKYPIVVYWPNEVSTYWVFKLQTKSSPCCEGFTLSHWFLVEPPRNPGTPRTFLGIFPIFLAKKKCSFTVWIGSNIPSPVPVHSQSIPSEMLNIPSHS